MSFKVFRQTLLDRWKSILLLMVLFFGLMAYMTLVYPETANMTNVNDILESPAIQILLGKLQFDNSFESYISTKALIFTGLIMGGFVTWLSSSFLAGEIDHKTIDVLLAQPIRRERLVLARYAALVPIVILLITAALAGIVTGITAINVTASVPWLAYTLSYMGMFVLAFGAIALFISAYLSDSRRAVLVSLGVLVTMYFLETLGSVVDLLGPIRYLSLFHYAQYNAILMSRTLSLADFVVMLAVAVVFLALTVYAFRRRDINVA
jgi:ABC-2 type transport system permease protein